MFCVFYPSLSVLVIWKCFDAERTLHIELVFCPYYPSTGREHCHLKKSKDSFLFRCGLLEDIPCYSKLICFFLFWCITLLFFLPKEDFSFSLCGIPIIKNKMLALEEVEDLIKRTFLISCGFMILGLSSSLLNNFCHEIFQLLQLVFAHSLLCSDYKIVFLKDIIIKRINYCLFKAIHSCFMWRYS